MNIKELNKRANRLLIQDFKDVKAFFFDFDGVLADSVEVKTMAFAQLFEQYGQNIVFKVVEHHRRHGGMPRVEKFKYYYKNFLNKPLDKNELKALCCDFSRLVVDKVVSAPEISGAADFLKKWHNSILCFIISATPDNEIKNIVLRRGMEVFFREVLGSSMSKQENLEYLLKKYSLSPQECFFFGDAESDYRAATACGVNFIGIVSAQDAPLLQVVPDLKWVKDFTELLF